jgi:Asp/Glu/hydantoin racemase
VIAGVNPAWGVPAAEGFADSFRSAASVLDAVAGLDAAHRDRPDQAIAARHGPVRTLCRDQGHGIPVLAIDASGDEVLAAFLEHSQALLSAGAETIVLGCAGANALQEALREKLGVPVLDGVRAAVALCEDLVCQGLRTSKAGAFGP